MPIATNPDTGEVVYLDDAGKWSPAKTAVNPQTREMMAFDGKAWNPVTTHGHGILSYIDDAVRAAASGMTFGFADKIAAKMDELTGRGGTYAQNVAQQQARTAEEPAAIRIPGEIGGAVASTVATAPARGVIAAATGLSKLPALVKAIGAGAATGASFGAGEAQPGQEASGAITGGAIGGATGGALSLAGKAFGAAGDKIMTSVIRPTARDISDGFSLDTIKKYNLGGSLNTTYDKTQELLGNLSSQLREKLSASNEKINLPSIVDETQKELTTAAGKLKGFGANQKIAAALDSLKQEVATVGGDVSIPDAQLVKQASGAFGAWQYGRPDPDSKASEIVFNTFYNKLKSAIEKSSPDGVKEPNQQISKLIPVNNALIRRMPVAERNYMISLSDMVGLAASAANPKALGLTALNLMQKSGSVGNALSKLGPNIPKATVPASALASKFGRSIFSQ